MKLLMALDGLQGAGMRPCSMLRQTFAALTLSVWTAVAAAAQLGPDDARHLLIRALLPPCYRRLLIHPLAPPSF